MSIIPESKNLLRKEKDGVPFYAFPNLEKLDGIRHGFSTRLGGVSEGSFSSMNLSFSRGDNDEKVYENFRRFCNAIEVPVDRLVISHQTHTKNVMCVGEEAAGSGVHKERAYDNVDGLITNVPNLPLCTLYADCVPLLFADPIKRVVATSHAGWRGTALEIGVETVNKMRSEYGCSVSDIQVGIGPSIGKCCFEVDQPVFDEFSKLSFFDDSMFVNHHNGKYHIDLWNVNKTSLVLAGVPSENIVVTDVCTRCHPDTMWSHRYTGPDRGSLAAFISIS